ncbi:hypothetical protein K458DRAFT_388756 [Lentithecium fluviatile CBS 122367]|uniref:Uncharacterized protein n=1 Tax=Lentithecium fluviatile CBS 122367 TaxID=1168545 RepID=A0A6G1J260_9PLEO|nr:hypothetical protein K458DRAFT_388756 [Lentithecium fluviatile CBS 122367]
MAVTKTYYEEYRRALGAEACFICQQHLPAAQVNNDPSLPMAGKTGYRSLFGTLGETTQLPIIECFDSKAQVLFEWLMLSHMQCQFALIILGDILKQEFLEDAASTVAKIGEIYFIPKHLLCTRHFAYRVKMKFRGQYALGFTDRQLGWRYLVRPWPEYYNKCINVSEEIDTSPLGKYTELSVDRNQGDMYRKYLAMFPKSNPLDEAHSCLNIPTPLSEGEHYQLLLAYHAKVHYDGGIISR